MNQQPPLQPQESPYGQQPFGQPQWDKQVPQYQPSFYNQPIQPAPRKKSGIWQWYKSRTRKVKISIGCQAILAVLLLFACIGTAVGSLNLATQSTPTPTTSPHQAAILVIPAITTIPTPTPTPNFSGPNPTSKLTWAPPPLNNPITINLTTTHQDLNLNPTKDYILKMPRTPVVGVYGEEDVIYISGGHNIVIIGGEIHVPNMPDSMNGVTSPHLADQRQAMRLDGTTGTVFIEGLEVSGLCMDFIDISAPLATVIFQNVRVEQCRSHDEVNFSDEHPDLIQPWGGAHAIYIDRFTGFTDAQGFQLDSDLDVVGNIVIKHANIGHIPGLPQYGFYYMWQDCNGNLCGNDANPDPLSPNYPHWDMSDDSFYIQPGANSFGKSVWPDVDAAPPKNAVLAPDRQSISWPNWPQKMVGRVRLGPPPRGDFVPAGSVGIGYVSPGYLNGSTPAHILSSTLSIAPSPKPTVNPNNTIFSTTLCPLGLGNCGDNEPTPIWWSGEAWNILYGRRGSTNVAVTRQHLPLAVKLTDYIFR